MYLLKLYTNNSNFKPIKFNKSGISIIIGTNKNTEKDKNTFNGVGKSLSIKLIDFCLGSSEIPDLKKLGDWVFFLEIEIDQKLYVISRSVQNQKILSINNIDYDEASFKKWMTYNINPYIPDNIFLTYRSVLRRFLRPNKESYLKFDKVSKEEQVFSRNINEAYILGLNTSLAEEKYKLLRDLDENSSFKAKLLKNSNLSGMTDLQEAKIQKKLDELNKKIQEFKIMHNYTDIESEQEKLQNDYEITRNNISLVENNLQFINNSLKEKIDLNYEDIEKLYNDAQVELGDLLKNKLSKIAIFHENLLQNRKSVLLKDKNDYEITLKSLRKKRKLLQSQIDKNYELLNTSGTFKEYETLINKTKDYSERLQENNILKKQLKDTNDEIRNLQKQFLDTQEKSSNYFSLVETKNMVENIKKIFYSFSKTIYPDRISLLRIEDNESNKSQLRYIIEPEIEHSSSDGVGKAKIFCYDMTKLLLKNTAFKFLVHDGRLFESIDPTQIKEMIELSYEKTTNNNLQYIFNINQNFLDSLKEKMKNEKFKSIIEKNIVARLTDEKPLLGKRIEIKY